MSGFKVPRIKEGAKLDHRTERHLQEILDLWNRTHAFGPNAWLTRHLKKVLDAEEAIKLADLTQSLKALNASNDAIATLVTELQRTLRMGRARDRASQLSLAYYLTSSIAT